MATETKREPEAFHTQPQKEHAWLKRLVGDWAYETEVPPEPGQPPQKLRGTESVRSIGDLWVAGEGRGEKPGGGEAYTLITLGYDPQKGKYVGTWVGSMMGFLWVYEGEVDAAGNALTLSSVGPDFEVEGKERQYRDVVEFQDDDHRTLTGKVLGDDGQWSDMMTVHYRRLR